MNPLGLLESLNPYLALLCLIGTCALGVLVFAQGRELRRLRDWAGDAPEKAGREREAHQENPKATYKAGRR